MFCSLLNVSYYVLNVLVYGKMFLEVSYSLLNVLVYGKMFLEVYVLL